jgi:hypothetical protein
MYEVQRKGRQKIVTMRDDHSEAVFYDVDNLDTKVAMDTINNYERVFVAVRDALEGTPYCCDDFADRLSIAQVVSDVLRRYDLIKKAGAP